MAKNKVAGGPVSPVRRIKLAQPGAQPINPRPPNPTPYWTGSVPPAQKVRLNQGVNPLIITNEKLVWNTCGEAVMNFGKHA